MKTIGSKILLVILLFAACNSFANNNELNDEYAKDVKHLFEVNGSANSFKQSIKTMIQHFKSQESDVPSSYWEKAEQEFLKTSFEDLYNMIVPIYRKNLSHDDVKAMIAFFESDAGKRIAHKIPNITAESMQAGMIWGQEIGKKIHEDIQSKGYKIRLPFMP
ncbi:DUF2059 domain-containing protein [Marinifilum caeruleilacunae]|uniref:DUF2059 domain-containing protein n=1 Tax=Marinifilum caeruleilacunae TaxID=2499076 RepID=A0ABX1X1K9_9BACT|nr:DUF2059 domain-containing protein [Marinifilum caeruleilacunae]NOU62106.1 DUF2059 domain-containing protein [Marinifilum caeruleilacunae]